LSQGLTGTASVRKQFASWHELLDVSDAVGRQMMSVINLLDQSLAEAPGIREGGARIADDSQRLGNRNHADSEC
jgi:hypothetical protein